MTLMLTLFGVLVWVPHVLAHPEAHFNWSECILTFLTTGAYLGGGGFEVFFDLGSVCAAPPRTTAADAVSGFLRVWSATRKQCWKSW